ncbi:filamentous hemagglutinin N-terminal domain-containing protein [Nostoc sp. LPT]|uniref:two-partner secretion domain-containing protein n=1 Tax=Nostoc sp. LPT TaxID=2815387 RepID=UPI001DBF8ACD|nr:filamentous hemagglutinin N-terminal domain-containing protein [Nostoc sp. LPT]MBN4006702.1 filamentous hemagglutinin N-terminal domain-containing protein [Nostoc sp. LPT]
MSLRSWFGHGCHLGLSGLMILMGAIGIEGGDRTFAQVTPDPFLGTKVESTDGRTYQIRGGTTVGGRNLFHSFNRFDVPDGGSANFLNDPTIVNIFSRVTGGNQSVIQGLISAQDKANLFLINPNGIIFGKNAQLNIGGSFIVTTANAIQFPGGGEFSMTSPVNPSNPLLTVNPSAFLFNQIANQPINSIQVNGASLSVDNGQNLLLVGGNVTLDNNAKLKAPDGRIELGGVAGSGTVGLNFEANTLRLNYPVQVQRADVLLTNGSEVRVSDKGGGSIAINAQNLDVLKDSTLEAGIVRDLNSDGTPAVNITLDATKEMKISNSSIFNYVDSTLVGNSGSILIKAGSLSLTDVKVITRSRGEKTDVKNSGNINIQTGSLYLTNDSLLTTSNSTAGRAGNVIIDAQNTVSVEDSLVTSNTSGLGNAGTINITAGELTLTKGGVISSITTGEGNAGNINIYPVNAFSSVNISGFNADPTQGYSSGLVTSSEKEGAGQGGNINVTTGELRLSDGGVLTARTRNASPSGNITVKVNTLEATNGGQVITSTFGTGGAGNITVTATDWVKISGSDPTYFNRLNQQNNPTIVDNDDSASGLFARVRSQETAANPGNIWVKARSINLDNQGKILATTTLGEGGNIVLQPQDFLIMHRGSQISTSAGTEKAGGNGGNITIDAPNGFIVAVPNENSDITANAFTGKGGRVDIKAFGIYGIQFRVSPTPLSDITASSEFGTQGTVELNTPDIDPNSGLTELPTTPVDTKVAQGCYSPGYAQNRFVIVGRGGLPPNPKDILTPDAPLIDWLSFKPRNNNRSLPPVRIESTTSTPKRIVEATGATLNAYGQIVLSANSSTPTPHTSIQNPIQCYGS